MLATHSTPDYSAAMNTIPVLQPGEIEEDRPMPSLNHSIVCNNLAYALGSYRGRLSAHQQLNLNLDGWASVPDVCVFPGGTLHASSMSDVNEVTIAPALVIEVLSPMQTLQPLLDKVQLYHSHGVQTCWIIIPGSRTVTVYPRTGPSIAVAAAAVVDKDLGIEVPLSEIFFGIEP